MMGKRKVDAIRARIVDLEIQLHFARQFGHRLHAAALRSDIDAYGNELNEYCLSCFRAPDNPFYCKHCNTMRDLYDYEVMHNAGRAVDDA